MDFKDFNILRVLYEEKNIKKTADRLFLSQPAISYRIQQLEKELNINILLRGNKGVKFTLQGEYLVESSKKMLLEKEKIIEYVRNMDHEVQGTLKLGVANNFALYRLPSILDEFVKAFPKVKIALKTGIGNDIMKQLHNDEIHIGIESAGHKWPEQKVLISTDKICIISKDKIAIDDLPTLPFIRIATPSINRLLTTWWLKKFSTPPVVTVETDYVAIGKRMVMSGLGVAFVPSFCLGPDDPLHVIELEPDNEEEFIMESWMNYRESAVKLSIVNEFIKFMGSQS